MTRSPNMLPFIRNGFAIFKAAIIFCINTTCCGALKSVCVRMSSVQDTKVDITSLDIEQNIGHRILVCLNFNIPEDKQADPEQFQDLLSDISDFLTANFLPNSQVTFQVTAAYYLKNRYTDQERLWTGSFFPGNRVSLSGPYFQIFSPQTFSRKLQQYTLPLNVLQNLTWNQLDTEWDFKGVASFIINCQVGVSEDHEFLRTFDLHSNRRRRQRRHIILMHPW